VGALVGVPREESSLVTVKRRVEEREREKLNRISLSSKKKKEGKRVAAAYFYCNLREFALRNLPAKGK